MSPGFILFQGRLLGTAHLITLNPPRPDGGKHVIEARLDGGLHYTEEYEDADEAAGRYLALASELLDDPTIAAGIRLAAPEEHAAGEHLAQVTPLPFRG